MGKREHIYEIIAENIRKERRRLGITQAELAERADVSLDTIKSVENGRRAMSLDTYLNIVHALESSPPCWNTDSFSDSSFTYRLIVSVNSSLTSLVKALFLNHSSFFVKIWLS